MTTKPIDVIDDNDLLLSLRSAICPFCGGWKRYGETLCIRDYNRFDLRTKAELHSRPGCGLQQAINDAARILGKGSIYAPSFTSTAA